jgi:acyl-CoA synthetase (AMP-forming)/AMP-acid ligase II
MGSVGTALPSSQQLLPCLVDEIAQTEPNAVWAEFPASATTYSDGFVPITYRQLSNAVNGVAWCLFDALGPADGKSFDTLAYLGPNDWRYMILVLAAVKAGYKVSAPSRQHHRTTANAWMVEADVR